MRGTVMHAPGDVRVEDVAPPVLQAPTDAIIRLTAACVCGSDLWPYRGIEAVDQPRPMGHEYVGVVEEVGEAVTTITPGQFVIGSFFASDNACAICLSGYQSGCVQRQPVGGAQAFDDARGLVPHHERCLDRVRGLAGVVRGIGTADADGGDAYQCVARTGDGHGAILQDNAPGAGDDRAQREVALAHRSGLRGEPLPCRVQRIAPLKDLDAGR